MIAKTFTVDWDSYESVSRLGNIIKSRLGELHPNKMSKKERIRQTLNHCDIILKTDITDLYCTAQLDPTPKYYVYAHLDPTKKIAIGVNPLSTFAATLGMSFIPFYVGKGTENRCFDTNRSETHRKVKQRLSSFDANVMVYKIKEGLTETEALCLESKLIDIFGLIPNGGILTNLDEGLQPEKRRERYLASFSQLSLYNKGMLSYKKKKSINILDTG